VQKTPTIGTPGRGVCGVLSFECFVPKLSITTDGIHLFSVDLTWGKKIPFGNLEFIGNRFNIHSLSPEGYNSGAAFVGMVHSRLPSLHAILKELASENDSALSDGGSSGFPIPWDCNLVTPAVPNATMPLPQGTLAFQTIPIVQQQTALP
jgi:hypothetical protein